MNSLAKLPVLLLQSALMAGGPVAIAMLGRAHPTRFLGIALVGLGAALTLFFLELIFDRRLPHLSFKSFQASVTLALVSFAVPMTVQFVCLGRFSPIFITLMTMTSPLWLWMYSVGYGKKRPLYLAIALAAPLVFLMGTYEDAVLLPKAFAAYGLLTVAAFSFSVGIGFCKRIFWIHSSSSLAFWALMIGSLGLAFFAALYGEFDRLKVFGYRNLVFFFTIGACCTGLSTFLYRFISFRASNRMKVLSTLVVGGASFGLTYNFLPLDAPINFYTMTGLGVTLITLCIAALSEGSAQWFSLQLANSVRQGDRVVCHLKGYLRKDDGPVGKLVVHDLSIGGLGFKTDTEFRVADHVLVTVPIGENWSQVTLDCRVVHWHRVPQDPELPYIGGLEFLKLNEESIQHLVEFLARIGHNPLENQKVA